MTQSDRIDQRPIHCRKCGGEGPPAKVEYIEVDPMTLTSLFSLARWSKGQDPSTTELERQLMEDGEALQLTCAYCGWTLLRRTSDNANQEAP